MWAIYNVLYLAMHIDYVIIIMVYRILVIAYGIDYQIMEGISCLGECCSD